MIGTTARDHFIAELAERFEEQDEEVFASGEPLFDELELIRRPNGELGWYLTTKLPVRGGSADRSLVGLVSVSRDLVVPSDTDIGAGGLREVVRHVQDHFGEPIRVADLARAAGFGEAQLERRMKRVFGVTATQACPAGARSRLPLVCWLIPTSPLLPWLPDAASMISLTSLAGSLA